MKILDELFESAIKAGKDRKYKKSLNLFLELINESDSYPSSYLYMGRCCHALNDPSQAIIYFKNYQRLVPNSLSIYFFMGRSYLSLGANGLALRSFLEVFNEKPDYPGIKAFVGLAYLKRKKFAQAVSFLGDAVEEAPENKRVYLQYLNALFVHAIKLFYQEEYDLSAQIFYFLEEKEKPHILLNLYIAMIERESGNFEQSLKYFNKSMISDPNNEMIKLQRSEVLYHLGQKEEAMRSWETLSFAKDLSPNPDPLDIIKMNAIQHFQNLQYRKAFYFATKALHIEKDVNMHLLAGESSRCLSEWERAENHFTRALELNGKLIEARYGIAMLRWQQEEYESLIEELNIILKYNPEDELSNYYLSLAKERIDSPVDEVLPLIQNQIRKTGPDPYLFNALGNIYIRGDMPDLSEKWYRKAIALKPDFKDAYMGLFYVSEIFSNNQKIKLLEDYLHEFPKDYAQEKKLVDLYLETKKYRKAIPRIKKIMPYFDDIHPLRRQMAFCYREIKQYDKASQQYKELLKSDPKNSLFLRSLVYSLEKSGSIEVAIAIMDTSMDYFNRPFDHLLILGVLLHHKGDLDNSLTIFREASDKRPKDWRPINNMAVIYREKGMDEYAMDLLKKAKTLKGK